MALNIYSIVQWTLLLPTPPLSCRILNSSVSFSCSRALTRFQVLDLNEPDLFSRKSIDWVSGLVLNDLKEPDFLAPEMMDWSADTFLLSMKKKPSHIEENIQVCKSCNTCKQFMSYMSN